MKHLFRACIIPGIMLYAEVRDEKRHRPCHEGGHNPVFEFMSVSLETQL